MKHTTNESTQRKCSLKWELKLHCPLPFFLAEGGSATFNITHSILILKLFVGKPKCVIKMMLNHLLLWFGAILSSLALSSTDLFCPLHILAHTYSITVYIYTHARSNTPACFHHIYTRTTKAVDLSDVTCIHLLWS